MRNSIIQGAGRLIAVVGAEDLIVVDSEDTLLICNRNREQDLRRVLAKLREAGREGFV
jgi:mannose-1-phosphate guanylyltransferase